jgi:hypothetical protein
MWVALAIVFERYRDDRKYLRHKYDHTTTVTADTRAQLFEEMGCQDAIKDEALREYAGYENEWVFVGECLTSEEDENQGPWMDNDFVANIYQKEKTTTWQQHLQNKAAIEAQLQATKAQREAVAKQVRHDAEEERDRQEWNRLQKKFGGT